jgi:hypothetical protein
MGSRAKGITVTTKAHAATVRKLANKYRAPNPGSSRVHPPVAAEAAARAIYDGRERLGSYRRFGDRWLAVDRLGKPLGQYDSELEAQDAISKAVRA